MNYVAAGLAVNKTLNAGQQLRRFIPASARPELLYLILERLTAAAVFHAPTLTLALTLQNR